MPQTFCVVQCHACRTFCVQIEKKVPRFKCAVCATQQAMQRVYARSSKAKDCREVVTKYNAARGDAEFEADLAGDDVEAAQLRQEEEDDERFGGAVAGPRRWGDYAAGEEPEADDDWTLAAPAPVPKKPRAAPKGEGGRKRRLAADEDGVEAPLGRQWQRAEERDEYQAPRAPLAPQTTNLFAETSAQPACGEGGSGWGGAAGAGAPPQAWAAAPPSAPAPEPAAGPGKKWGAFVEDDDW